MNTKIKPNENDADLRATAYHEAGHCVAAICYGRTIRYVTITPGKRKNAQGQVMIGRTLIRRPRLPQSTEQKKAEVNAALMSSYAGVICESAAIGKSVDLSSCADDHKAARDIVMVFLGEDTDPATLQSVLLNLYQGTQRFFMTPGALQAVRRVADALMVRRTLTGGEVKRIVLQAFDGEG
jgi:ATP-dependent Zn protease